MFIFMFRIPCDHVNMMSVPIHLRLSIYMFIHLRLFIHMFVYVCIFVILKSSFYSERPKPELLQCQAGRAWLDSELDPQDYIEPNFSQNKQKNIVNYFGKKN